MKSKPITREPAALPDITDPSRQPVKSEIFRIITSRSFDLVALIHLKSRLYEAVYLGDSLPAAYRRYLPRKGAICSFDDFCAEALKHLDPGQRADYQRRSTTQYMRRALETGDGSYEFTLKEYFPDCLHGFMYRKFLHYRLENDPDAVLVIESDETEASLRQAEALNKARDRAEHDRLIMDSVMGGIAVLALDDQQRLRVEYFNSYVFSMLGYDPVGMPKRAEDAKGTPSEPLFADALTFVHPEDRDYVRQAFITHRDAPTFFLKPYRMFGNLQKCYWVLERVRTGLSDQGQRIFYAAFHDVSEQVELQNTVTRQLETEQQLRREADMASAAKSDFLSRMSHDMRTPLNGVIGMAYLAQKEDNPARTADCLAKISTSAKFLLDLINNVLDMSKMEKEELELHPEPYRSADFKSYIDAVIRPLCDGKNQQLIVSFETLDHCVPQLDILRINQILFNLLSNAVKNTHEGGTIRLSVQQHRIPGSKIHISVEIRDNGIGMSEAFQAVLFDPFTQENRDDASEMRGSGLGLAIVKKIIDAMGGTITVNSRIGEGTAFHFEFDCDCREGDTASASPRSARADNTLAALQGRHVLLCEDHPLNQEIARSLLTSQGVLVDVAENGEIGVRHFAASTLYFYDAVLMDIRMPVMDGLEATRALRALPRADAGTVPIIAMTADALKESVQKGREAGMNAYVTKPVEPEKLYAALAQALKNRRP